jgi:2-polyprenyl-3-methyl-5-hydroxy-6-metoxy-1,4-benzoquinol methylase/ribosomal protein S27E
MKEEDIRKRDVFNEYLRLSERDAKAFFVPRSFVKVRCPACSGGEFAYEFEKTRFRHVTCANCGTLFVNPRPPLKEIYRFYADSPSTRFWVNEFFKPVAEVRRKMIFRPRAEYIRGMLGKTKRRLVGDIGAGFGIFLEELRDLLPDNRYVAIEPSVEMAEICRRKGLQTRPVLFEEIDEGEGKFDLLSAFELVEHLYDPAAFFRKARALLKSGGLFFFTTLNGNGFDIALLRERSKSVSPPHHLNYFNTESIRRLLERTGFAVKEISTPGKLDWDIVEGMIRNEGVKAGPFWERLARQGSDECKRGLQDWITANNLSSHMRVIARKARG